MSPPLPPFPAAPWAPPLPPGPPRVVGAMAAYRRREPGVPWSLTAVPCGDQSAWDDQRPVEIGDRPYACPSADSGGMERLPRRVKTLASISSQFTHRAPGSVRDSQTGRVAGNAAQAEPTG